MSGYYGWSYTNRLQPQRKREKVKTNCYQKQRRFTKARHWEAWLFGHAWTLRRAGRCVVVLLLLVLSVVVLGKERTLRVEVLGKINATWVGIKNWLGQDNEVNASEARQKIKEHLAVKESIGPSPSWPVKPLAIILDTGLFMLDENGTLWPLPYETLPGDLPVITGLVVREVPGNLGVILRAEIDIDLIREILAVPYCGQISEVNIGSREGVVLYTRDAIKILLRHGRTLERDLKRLGAVISDIRVKQKKIAFVDLRYNQHVVVRPKRRR